VGRLGAALGNHLYGDTAACLVPLTIVYATMNWFLQILQSYRKSVLFDPFE
jgi:hypothetical protein